MIFEATTQAEAEYRFESFLTRWRLREPEMVAEMEAYRSMLFQYYCYPVPRGWIPTEWRHRLRTTNLVEGYSHHLRSFLMRVSGWIDEHHIDCLVGLHLFGFKAFYQHPEILYQPNFNTNY